ncbi:hypothetical protein [Modicisalibacter radicis]|uniref:hypothetical protein n=1 Tax=Halomonas sp. EAR18 TaxID=2518972 RepID=UPI00109CA53A|nr:hypothetical protein [Halomonas sp. EAR18]
MKRIVLLSIATAVFCTQAWSATSIKPGKYNVTSTAYNETAPAEETTNCFTPQEAEDFESTLRKQLDISPGNKSEALDVTIEDEEHFSADITYAADSPNPLTLIWEGEWVGGACP